MNYNNSTICLTLVGILLTYLNLVLCHKHAKVQENRVHQDDIVIHEERIHVRHSGLENFAEINKDGVKNVLKNQDFVRNKEHIGAHVKQDLKFEPETATAEELDFHFFNIHDNDDNKALDGLELFEAIMHGLEEQFEDIEDDEDMSEQEKEEETRLLYDSAHRSVDRVLEEDDRNADGYISISEFLNSRRVTGVIREAHEEEY